MRIPIVIISAASLVALSGIAKADDHLFQAGPEGVGALSEDSQPFQPHGANNVVPEEVGAGQGSPFTGEVMQTPSSLIAGGNPGEGILGKPNANIKPREPK
jgi:hypothetical protein